MRPTVLVMDDATHEIDEDGPPDGEVASGMHASMLFLRLIGVLFLSHYPTDFVLEFVLESLGPLAAVVIEAALLGLFSGGLVWLIVLRPLRRNLDEEHDARLAREQDLLAEANRQRFEGRLARGVEMAETEDQVFEVLDRALADDFGGVEAALLLADTTGGHLTTALDTGDDETARTCGVAEPRACPAVRSGHALVFEEADAVDSCPQLVGGPRRCGAICVPMQASGRAVGVLHLPLVEDRPMPDQQALGAVVATVGRRLGMLRVMAQTSHRASTDSLTGLPNRRTLEDRITELLRVRSRVAVVVADLDRFKLLNDTHGHAVGDRALKSYAETLLEVLRPDDVVGRYGGEEFLLAMPDAGATEAAGVVQRLRAHLAKTLEEGGVPAFTASYGIADTTIARDLGTLVRAADAAMYRAKQTGRDRGVVADEASVRAAGIMTPDDLHDAMMSGVENPG